jgi:hypothetical protein
MESINQITKPQKAGTMNKLTKYLNAAVLGVLILIEGTSKASANTIFSQTFNGGSGSLLNTTPTTGSGTWTGDGILNRNGALAGRGTDVLAFTPTSGLVYDLTATINATSGTWIGVGFLKDSGIYGWFPSNPTLLNTATQWQAWAGPGVNYDKTSNDILIRLDTRASEWTVAFYQRDLQMEYTQIGQTYTYTSGNPTINYVGFVSEGGAEGTASAPAGTVSAFQLTAIPEPSACSLVLGGIMSLLLIRRWRK